MTPPTQRCPWSQPTQRPLRPALLHLACLLALATTAAHAQAKPGSQEGVCVGGPLVRLSLRPNASSTTTPPGAHTLPDELLLFGALASFGTVPPSNGTAMIAPLVLAQPADACSDLTSVCQGCALLVARGGCSFLDKAVRAQAGGAAALLVEDSQGAGCVAMGADPANASLAHTLQLPCVSITGSDGQTLAALVSAAGPGAALVALQLEVGRAWDPGMGLLAVLAVATVAVGGLWAGQDHVQAVAAGGGKARSSEEGGGAAGRAPVEVLDITAKQALLFVFLASCMLLLLFFIMNQAVMLVMVALFCLASINALTVALTAALTASGLLSPPTLHHLTPLPLLGPCPTLTLVVAPLAAALSGVWFVWRRAGWSWVLQDVQGVALMLLVLRTLRLSSMKVACILLPLLFFYDVFWVFLSPLLFNGTSVMVEVASGGSAQEPLPMLLRVPLLWAPPGLPGYSMLGFGDIIMPGLLVAFMRRWDLTHRLPLLKGHRLQPPPGPDPGAAFPESLTLRDILHGGYFLPVCCGYAGGLALTYTALACSWFGDQGQPALLYLVPCTLGLVLALAAGRGHWSALFADTTLTVNRAERGRGEDGSDTTSEDAPLLDVESGPNSSLGAMTRAGPRSEHHS
ncbi:signal peptide peptidase-like protein [Haematococcus lacustris]